MNVTMKAAHDLKLHQIDVNLLVAFDALVEERSVTKAAMRVGVTQSAMSHTLKRLRELLDDALLVRGGKGMLLTPRAEALRAPIRGGLTSLSRALCDGAGFTPITARRTFRVTMPDSLDVLVMPELLRDLRIQAPHINVVVLPYTLHLNEALETGTLDAAVVPVLLDEEPFVQSLQPAPDLRQKRLLRDRMRCFLRAGHPLAERRRVSLKTYVELEHVLVSPTGSGSGIVDRALAREELERRVALRVPTHSSALAIVAQTDHVLTAPRSFEKTRLARDLVSLAVPLSLPEHSINLMWHPRFNDDPANRWFRETLEQATQRVVRT